MRQHFGKVVGVVSRSVTREDGQPPNVIVDELKTANQILAHEGLDVPQSFLQPIRRQPELRPVRQPRPQPIGSAVRQVSAQETIVHPANAEIVEGPVETMGEAWEVMGDSEVAHDSGLVYGDTDYVDQVIGGSCETSCVTGNCGRCYESQKKK